MTVKFERCIEVVLKHEGGFADHPRDPGGVTNYGISLRFARDRGTMLDMDGDGDVDRDDIRLLTPEKAKMVYREIFWRDVRGDELPPGVDLAVFDFAVNSGVSRAIRFMQTALGVESDGVFGPKTMAAVKAADPQDLINKICDARLDFLKKLPTWETFGRGWTNRVNDVHKNAEALVGQPYAGPIEVLGTDTAKAASAVAIIGAVGQAVTQAEPALKVLGGMAPWLAGALLVAAVVGVAIWRMRRV